MGLHARLPAIDCMIRRATGPADPCMHDGWRGVQGWDICRRDGTSAEGMGTPMEGRVGSSACMSMHERESGEWGVGKGRLGCGS